MALTITRRERNAEGNTRTVIADVTFDNSYPTGGEAVTAAQFGLHKIVDVQTLDGSGYSVSYDRTNAKLLLRQSAGSAAAMGQVPNATDLSAVTVRVKVVGK